MVLQGPLQHARQGRRNALRFGRCLCSDQGQRQHGAALEQDWEHDVLPEVNQSVRDGTGPVGGELR